MKKNHNKKGVTIVEVLLSAMLFSVIFLGVSGLYLASQKVFITRDDKVVISYELQYAAQHIYKNTMRAIGHKEPDGGRRRGRRIPRFLPIQVLDGGERLRIRINNNNPLTRDNYEDVDTYTYSKSDNELIFNDGNSQESLTPKVDIAGVNFSLDENLLTVSLTGSYREETVTIHTACYPRMASFR